MTVPATIAAMVDGSLGWEAGLDALTVAPADEVDPALMSAMEAALRARWRGGWQPVELHRVITRRTSITHAHLIRDGVGAELQRFPPDAVDPRWTDQADALRAGVWWEDTPSYLEQLATIGKVDRVVVLDLFIGVLCALAELPPISILIPPPGTVPPPGRSAGAGPVDPGVLGRVRGLLAKAESSSYPAEAEAYTTKAQELVTRHSIDTALLAARADGPAEVVPFARRIGVDSPYESEKAAVLDAVARANHCQAVWSPELGFVTVFGFDPDLDAVDLLHTSLLLQAQRAMARSEPPSGKAGRARLRAFRQSFLVAFAVRIGERLAGAAESAVADAARAESDLLPVLAARDEQVRQSLRRVFPRTVADRGGRADSQEGWDSGRTAADLAALPLR